MSRKRLLTWVLASLFWLLLYAASYILFEYLGNKGTVELMKALLPLALALPTAVLAAAFTRRNSYLQGLRELWGRLIPAAQSAIQYTHLSSPDQTAFAKTQEALSTAIDLVRGVFANVASVGAPSGLYPYENLKDIQAIISWLGYGPSFRAGEAARARTCVTRLWQEMHRAMLSEFDRDTPISPVSKYLSDGKSLADLLINGELKDEHLAENRRASNPNAA